MVSKNHAQIEVAEFSLDEVRTVLAAERFSVEPDCLMARGSAPRR
jgi:hypothetical protein